MTKMLLPKLLEKKKGVIVNLSSSAAELCPPMFTVYVATKVTFFPQAHELWYNTKGLCRL